jgi:hypothetical protein
VAWDDVLAALVAAHGTLTAVAWKLVELAGGDDVASVERALRRLRGRGQRDGGTWGQRVLRVFGVPRAIEDRVRWMGQYHSSFNDLPVALCRDQIRLWDRPPIADSRARVWLDLARASCALRERAFDDARAAIERAEVTLAALGAEYDAARIEAALAGAYLASRLGIPSAPGAGMHDPALERATALLRDATLDAVDRACLTARLVDHLAYRANHAGDHAAALALYETLDPADVHPFASYRRDAGLAYGHFARGRLEQALALARRACTHAGDGGYTRLRAMGLLLVARIADDPAAADRAAAIAARLGDEELAARVRRRRRS